MAVQAQGTVDFANVGGGGVPNAPVYMSDGVTLLSGPQFMAELLGGPSATSLAPIATTSFLTSATAGYFFGGTATIDSVQPTATAWVQVEVWNTASGASFGQAKASGRPNSWWESSVFTVATGGPILNPAVPGELRGLGTSPVYLNGVPEPSTLALVGLAAASVLRRLIAT